MKLLQELTAIRGASGDEGAMKDFILDYVEKNKSQWRTQPEVIHGKGFQDTVILVFGKPRTAVFAHTDTIGFTAAYGNTLYKIGGPKTTDGIQLVGSDSLGEIETELMVIEESDGTKNLTYVFERDIDRGTNLTFKPDFRETDEYVQSPYMDNRLGVWNALMLAQTIEDGAIVFSTYEEHGGNSVGFCARYLWEKYELNQALISDITWVTDGVLHGEGVAISMRDTGIPRRSYLNRIVELAKKSNIKFQLEVEGAGGSDGTMLQKSDLPFDWLFIGAPEDNVHSPDEKVFKSDIRDMLAMYQYLMKHL
ncbi:MAG: aminopeptidase [Crocinitomicaceae bacterium]|nr:aminopeptidase [Crocinitomicaceae bacterium]